MGNTAKLKQSITAIFEDKTYLVLLIILAVFTIIFCITAIVLVHPSDVQLNLRYNHFNETVIANGYWYTLYSFAGIGVLFAFIDGVCSYYFFRNDRRSIAIGILILAFVLLLIAWLYFRSVLGLAYISDV